LRIDRHFEDRDAEFAGAHPERARGVPVGKEPDADVATALSRAVIAS